MMQSLPFILMSAQHAAPAIGSVAWLLQTNVLNVALVACLLIWLVKKFNVSQSLDQRRQAITQEIENLEQEKDASVKKLNELNQSIANIQVQVDEILAHARESAEHLAAHILQEAEHDALTIRKNAEQKVQLEQSRMVGTLQAELVQKSIEEVRRSLMSTLGDHDRLASVHHFLDDLPRLTEASLSGRSDH
jgi:F0F1-type ATP synthase membrane subunit b/b'